MWVGVYEIKKFLLKFFVEIIEVCEIGIKIIVLIVIRVNKLIEWLIVMVIMKFLVRWGYRNMKMEIYIYRYGIIKMKCIK